MQIQISWLLQKPTDLDLHCLQRQGISGFNMTTVKFYVICILGENFSRRNFEFFFFFFFLFRNKGLTLHGDNLHAMSNPFFFFFFFLFF